MFDAHEALSTVNCHNVLNSGESNLRRWKRWWLFAKRLAVEGFSNITIKTKVPYHWYDSIVYMYPYFLKRHHSISYYWGLVKLILQLNRTRILWRFICTWNGIVKPNNTEIHKYKKYINMPRMFVICRNCIQLLKFSRSFPRWTISSAWNIHVQCTYCRYVRLFLYQTM